MWPDPQLPADLVTFTEEILKGKLHFLCSERYLGIFIRMKSWSKFLEKFIIFLRHCELVLKKRPVPPSRRNTFQDSGDEWISRQVLLDDLLIHSGTSNFKVIKKIKRGDSGGYRCTASNLQGTKGSHVVTVDVQCRLISQTFS